MVVHRVLNTVSRKYSSVYIPRIKKTADSLHKVLNASVTDINQGISISDTMKNTFLTFLGSVWRERQTEHRERENRERERVISVFYVSIRVC